jgi:hypothetical protein
MPDDRARLPDSSAERVLLLNPPVYDTRIHWPKWHQPTTLLRLASHFLRAGADVRIVDAMHRGRTERLRRERVASLDLDGIVVHKWRFGVSNHGLARQLRELARSPWAPDQIYVECLTTFWWQGAAEVAELARRQFPQSHITIVGSYARLAADHARRYTVADEIRCEPWPGLSDLPAALSVYANPPAFSYVSVGDGQRSAEEVVDEIRVAATKHRVGHFAFLDHAVASRHPALYRSILEKLIDERIEVSFYAPGNIAASDLVAQPSLAGLMKRAGCVQIFFSDDRDAPPDPRVEGKIVDDYRKAAALCHEAGFRARTDALVGSVCIGRGGENIEQRARLATVVAHHIGSVILWPYQPPPDLQSAQALENQNGKLFPLRQENGLTYRDYAGLLGLAVVLNAKYRTRTFDFLGDGLVPRLFRNSLERRAWEPDPEVKGSLHLPVRMVCR